jgi:RimJ/RimL family protein N-acetyltransferase
MRPFADEDLEVYSQIVADPEVMRYIGKGQALSYDEAKLRIERMLSSFRDNGFGMFAVIDRKSRRLIGRCGLQYLDNSPEIELGYLFEQDAWGKGYATESAKEVLRHGFQDLEMERIVAVTYPENTPSRRVLEKIGLKYIGEAFHHGINAAKYEGFRKAES